MGATDDVMDLIHLADRPGTSRHRISVRVLGRWQPGILFGHDFLACEIVITAEALSATFSVTLLPEDLEDWEDTLANLEARRSTTWLASGRTPSLTFAPDGDDPDPTARLAAAVLDFRAAYDAATARVGLGSG